MLTRIALLTGGTSSERDIALQSAAYVEEELAPHFMVMVYDFPKDLERFLQERSSIDLAIPLFHGLGGEDGTIQGFLKILGIPFIFSDVAAHAIGMNKAVTKDVLIQRGIKTANYYILRKGEMVPVLTKECVIKPLDGGSSVGVTIARDDATYQRGIAEGFRWSDRLLIEDYIPGTEFTVAVIEDTDGLIALPVIEIRTKHDFFDLESKYDSTLTDKICPAQIPETLSAVLKELAIQTHQAIGAKHLSRTDFIVDEQGVADTVRFWVPINLILMLHTAKI